MKGDLVIGDGVGSLVCRGEVLDHNHGHALQLQLPRCQDAGVPGNDPALGVHQDRHHEAEGSNAAGELGNLLVRMGARVPR